MAWKKMFIDRVVATDEAALKLHKEDPAKAVAYLTDYSSDQVARTFNEYQHLYRELFMKFMDGNVKHGIPASRTPIWSSRIQRTVPAQSG